MHNAVVALVALLFLGVPWLLVLNRRRLVARRCTGSTARDVTRGQLPRMPSREALKTLTPEHIETALSSFTMRRQGSALTLPNAAPSPSSDGPAGRIVSRAARRDLRRAPTAAPARRAQSDPLAGPAWNGWGADLRNTRFQPAAAAGLSATDVPRLKLKWAFGFPGVSASGSQVTVVGGRAFVGSRNGMVYALDARTGCLAWAFEADAGVRSTPGRRPRGRRRATVYFGDAHAQVYALDAATGALRWKVKVENHPDAMITGAVAVSRRTHVRRRVVDRGRQGGRPQVRVLHVPRQRRRARCRDRAANLEDVHDCRSARATTKNSAGTQLWGPSGAASGPLPRSIPIAIACTSTTGDNYSNPATKESDAIMALAMDTGRIVWTPQTLAGDAWNVGMPGGGGPGPVEMSGIGRARSRLRQLPGSDPLANGRRVLLAGQKSGVMHGTQPRLRGAASGRHGPVRAACSAASGRCALRKGRTGDAMRVQCGRIRWRTPVITHAVDRERCPSSANRRIVMRRSCFLSSSSGNCFLDTQNVQTMEEGLVVRWEELFTPVHDHDLDGPVLRL